MNGVSATAAVPLPAYVLKDTEAQATLRTERRELIEEVGQLGEQIRKAQAEIEELSRQKTTLEKRLLESVEQNSSLLAQIEEIRKQLGLVQGTYTKLQEQYQQVVDQRETETRVKQELIRAEDVLKVLTGKRDTFLFRSRVVFVGSCVGGLAVGAPWLGALFGGSMYVLGTENQNEAVAERQKIVDELRAKIGLAPLYKA